MEEKKWTHTRITVEARRVLKIYAARHDITMSEAVIEAVRKAEAIEKE